MTKLINFLLKKLFSESEYNNEETIYNNIEYQMGYHDLYEDYNGYYDMHRRYEYWDYK